MTFRDTRPPAGEDWDDASMSIELLYVLALILLAGAAWAAVRRRVGLALALGLPGMVLFITALLESFNIINL